MEVPAILLFQWESFPVQGFGHGAHFLSLHLNMSHQMHMPTPPGYTIPLHQYLEDWLMHGETREQVKVHTQTLLHITQKLGFLVNLDKSELQPTHDCTFLLNCFLLRLDKVAPTEERWQKILVKILLFLQQHTCIARQWPSMLSLLTSTEKIVQLGMLHVT